MLDSASPENRRRNQRCLLATFLLLQPHISEQEQKRVWPFSDSSVSTRLTVTAPSFQATGALPPCFLLGHIPISLALLYLQERYILDS